LTKPAQKQEIEDQSILRADPKPDDTHSVTRMTFDTDVPNGLVFSADEKTLYGSYTGLPTLTWNGLAVGRFSITTTPSKK
jgi:sugar lactone lactonase YvrE